MVKNEARGCAQIAVGAVFMAGLILLGLASIAVFLFDLLLRTF